MPASPRMMLKITQIARMRISGIKDVTIARHLNITNAGLQRILRTSDYIEYEEAILAGHLSKMDERLAGKVDLLGKQARAAVPLALRTIIETAMQRKDLKTALAASKEILDRDPDRTLVKDQVGNGNGQSLPQMLFDSVAKDADIVAAEANKKVKEALIKPQA
jgi:hypothetical protein